jgi:ATP-dependent DNA helicase RecG
MSRENKPVAAAILLFGKNPRAYFPGAYIRFLRIDGPSLIDPILDQKESAELFRTRSDSAKS